MGKNKKNKKNKNENTQAGNSSVKLYAGVGIILILAAAVIVLVVMNQRADTVDSLSPDQAQTESIDVHLKGNADAVYQLVKYSDFGCVHCANLHVHLKRFMDEHGDDYSLQIRHFPINNNALSRMAVGAALSAGRQGKYWEMVDLLYENPNQWRTEPEQAILGFVQQLELDRDQFVQDMNDEDMMYEVVKKYMDYRESGINATPTLFLNGERIPNPRTYEQLENSLLQTG